MNRNTLKIIACISMVIDHVGYVLFPEVQILRLIGRIAMPIFAFFIGEGCYYTRDRKKYFLRLFILGLICQLVYIAEGLINNGSNIFYFNILFTFSCSILLCTGFLKLKEEKTVKNTAVFILLLTGFALMNIIFDFISGETGLRVTLDYGFAGIVLPLFALVSREERMKNRIYRLAVVLFAVFTYGFNMYAAFTLISAALLMLYNGKSGKKNMNNFFYLFYPLHLAVIYGIDMIVG